jgi:type II secretory pathway component PulC
VATILLPGCGGSSGPPPKEPAPRKARAAAEPAPAKRPKPPAGALWRQDVVEAVNSGLGVFLQHVDVEAEVDKGKFRGFRIVELRPVHYWAGVDLKPGDVVLSVNDMPIERETEAYRAFESLREAAELKVSYERAGERRELRYKIVAAPQ